MEIIVSVIIPVYNVEPYLRECLDSVISQTCRDIEIICVDDGSTDSSSVILEEYAAADPRIVLIQQENRGLSEARNAGVKSARGKYLFFLDSDDCLEADALQILSKEMEQRDLDFLCCNAVAFGDTYTDALAASKMYFSYLLREMDENRLFTGQELFRDFYTNPKNRLIAPPWAGMISRSFFLEQGLWFYPGIIHEDELWTFSVLMKAKRVGCLDRNLIRYRIRESSVTHHSPPSRKAYGLYICIREAQRILESPGVSLEEGMQSPINQFIIRLQKKAIYQYRSCSREEKEAVRSLSQNESLFESLIVYPSSLEDRITETGAKRTQDSIKWKQERIKWEQEKNKWKSAVEELNHKNTDLRFSKSFLIGRAITWLPRIIKKFFKRPMRIHISSESKSNRIQTEPPLVQGNRIVYQYQVEGSWKQYFNTQEAFEITYPFSLENVPESILIVPFLSQILPVAWICDAKLHVPVCDKAFYDCLEEVKAGYQKMYPMLSFLGNLSVDKIEDNASSFSEAGKRLVCFSGGVDALSTTLSHIKESPVLVSLWGSDVPAADEEAWKPLAEKLENDAQLLGLDRFVIRTSFRKLLSESKLNKLISDSGDGWWHGFQHGLGILGHMAPLAWEYHTDVVYIAASFTAKDHVTCASDPTIDNHVRFASAHVIHDGFDNNRQQKIRNILRYADDNNIRFPLHVCWEKKNGENCCHCEKCWRTMLAVYVEGSDPREYGFPYFSLSALSDDIEAQIKRVSVNAVIHFGPIQTRLRQRFSADACPEELKWLYHIDLKGLEDGLLCPHNGRIGRIAWLLGTPEYSNLGDQCIAEAEQDYIDTLFPDLCIREISDHQLMAQKYRQLDSISPSQLIFLQGGGNLGTLWPEHDLLRKEISTRLLNPIIVFPQSLFFSDDANGAAALAAAKEIYSRENVLLCCRESVSYSFAQKHFACRSILVPDFVLWESWSGSKKVSRYGAMTLFRNDKERAMEEESRMEVFRYLAATFHCLDVYDTCLPSGRRVTRSERSSIIQTLVDRISAVECVVTDRLHGMILCAITGTPCVVFGNSYHKVKSCYQWIGDLPYIRFINNVDELESAVQDVCAAQNKSYPVEQMRRLFAPLDEEIRALTGASDEP